MEKNFRNFEVDVDQLYELNEDIDKDTGDKIKAGQLLVSKQLMTRMVSFFSGMINRE
ncbi:MAG: hypothetical protein CM1200mP10_22410 [Candidatus Neomarinimicrobiota bacterium]|nr:MAG: hypothetical protein CM1200mP10_22410 [Candidatus Neomarinimicrobiota bacterium]